MKNWKKVIGNVAPMIATALGGPLSGTAVKFLADNLLGNPDATEKDISDYILAASPQELLKVKELNNQFSIEMERIGVDLEKIAAADRADAREMGEKTSLRPQIALSIVFIFGYFGLLWMLFSGTVTIDDSIRDMANILLGALSAGIPMILRFWFGGSPQDNDHMDRIYNSIPSHRVRSK